MIRAWVFHPNREDREELPLDAIAATCTDGRSLVWIDAEDPTAAEIQKLAADLALGEFLAEDLRNPHQRTKLERFDEKSHVAVHACRLVDDDLLTREIDLVFAPGWLLSVRHPDGRGFLTDVDEAVRRYDRQRLAHGSDDEGLLVWAVLDVLVDEYFAVVEGMDDRLDQVEDIVFGGGPTTTTTPREMFVLRRSMVEFRRAAAPLREVVAVMLRREIPTIGETTLVHLQDLYDHILRISDLLETQRELLTGLLEASLAVASNRVNHVMKLTSSWGAIILGATLIAGIYGMNFTHMPELDWRIGYPMALLLMLALTVVLYRSFRKRGWL